jgi:hypothetical protein
MRDNKSILLALLAAGLVITWVYHLYDKSQYSNNTTEVFVKDSSAVAKAVSDSLRIFFIHTLDQLDPEKIKLILQQESCQTVDGCKSSQQ